MISTSLESLLFRLAYASTVIPKPRLVSWRRRALKATVSFQGNGDPVFRKTMYFGCSCIQLS